VELRAVLDPQAAHRHVVAQEESYQLQMIDFHEQCQGLILTKTTLNNRISKWVAGRRGLITAGLSQGPGSVDPFGPWTCTDTDPNVTHVYFFTWGGGGGGKKNHTQIFFGGGGEYRRGGGRDELQQ
jgi:hypothetical protein